MNFDDLNPFSILATVRPSSTGKVGLAVNGHRFCTEYVVHENCDGVLVFEPVGALPSGRPCAHDGCVLKTFWASPFCEKHATRFAIHGDPSAALHETADLGLAEALLSKAVNGAPPAQFWDGNGYSEPDSSVGKCLEWGGHITAAGYGLFRQRLVHRSAFILEHGQIPAGVVIDHLCRNKKCFNVSHLEAVSSGENARRGVISRGLKTHCIHGHELVEGNLVVRENGGRRCATCVKERNKNMSAKKLRMQ